MRLASLLLVLFAASAVRAAPKDIADLFPAETIVYAEIGQPGATAKDLAGFLKGTALAKPKPLLSGFKELFGSRRRIDTTDAGLLATCLGPEMLKEAERFKGLALAVTGFDKSGEPEFLAVALTGESRLPAAVMQAFLTPNRNFKKVVTVEGIDVFQHTFVDVIDDLLALPRGGFDETIPTKNVGPLYAHQPGLILVGTNQDQVAAAIRRWKDKEKSAALSTTRLFRDADREPAKPGMFLFADGKALLERLHTLQRTNTDVDPFAWLVFRKLMPPAAVGAITGRLELKEEGIDLRCSLKIDRQASSPLFDLLEGQSIALPDFSDAAKGSPLALSLNLPSGVRRVPRLLAVIDAFAKASGTLGPSGSEVIDELEGKKVLSRADLARVDRLAVILPPMAQWVKESLPVPTLVMSSDSGATLAKIEAALPHVFEIFGGARADAVTETIDGVKVRTLEAKASPTATTVHFGRHGKALAVGTDRKWVASCLRPGASSTTAAPAVVAVWDWSATLRRSAPAMIDGPRSGRREYSEILSHHSPYYPDFRPPPRGIPWEAVANLKNLPPLVVTLGRQANEVRLVVRQPDPKGVRVKAIDRWFDWYSQSPNRYYPHLGDIMDGTSNGPILFPPPPIPFNGPGDW